MIEIISVLLLGLFVLIGVAALFAAWSMIFFISYITSECHTNAVLGAILSLIEDVEEKA